MKIKCTREGTTALGAKGLAAEFDEEGFATVDKDVGEALREAYPDIVEVVEKMTKKSSTKAEE